jgi:alpha-N-arabinofuranosidase
VVSLTTVQVINAGASSVPLSINLDADYMTVNGTILTANDVNAFNFMDKQTLIVPKKLEGLRSLIRTKELSRLNSFLSWDVPRWSITVLQFGRS